MARSRSDRRRSARGGGPAPTPPSVPTGVSLVSAPSLSAATLPRVWQGIGYRPLGEPTAARPLFDFTAVPWPDPPVAFGWGAFAPSGGGHEKERLVGALLAEQTGRTVFFHGPVVIAEEDPLEVAAQLAAAALDHAQALGAETVFARPHGLHRVWVRFGFVPLPESSLPAGLAGRPGVGLYGWRGGSAIWTLREPEEV